MVQKQVWRAALLPVWVGAVALLAAGCGGGVAEVMLNDWLTDAAA